MPCSYAWRPASVIAAIRDRRSPGSDARLTRPSASRRSMSCVTFDFTQARRPASCPSGSALPADTSAWSAASFGSDKPTVASFESTRLSSELAAWSTASSGFFTDPIIVPASARLNDDELRRAGSASARLNDDELRRAGSASARLNDDELRRAGSASARLNDDELRRAGSASARLNGDELWRARPPVCPAPSLLGRPFAGGRAHTTAATTLLEGTAW